MYMAVLPICALCTQANVYTRNAHLGQKMVSDPLECQTVVRCYVDMGIEPKCSGRAVSALNSELSLQLQTCSS